MCVAYSTWLAPLPGTPRLLRIWMLSSAGCMPSRLRVVPGRPVLAPTPRIVLVAETSAVPEPFSMPLTRMVRAPEACAWVRKSVQVETVTVVPPEPPVVPPPCVAQPRIPVGGCGFCDWDCDGDPDGD